MDLETDLFTAISGLKICDVAPKTRTAENLPLRFDVEIPRFDVDDQAGYDYLNENGYVVFKNVASAEEVAETRTMFWNWLCHDQIKSGMNRNDPATWNDDNFPGDPTTGIIGGNGIGQTDFCWKMRCLPKVRQAFSRIWETDDLITSFDGANVFRPWKYNSRYRTKGGWWHVDQNGKPGRWEGQGLQTIQGLVTLMDATDQTGGLCVIPRSKAHHEAICERSGPYFGGDFVPIAPWDPFFGECEDAVFVACQAGDLCLWDSRTVHCNTPSRFIGRSWIEVAEEKSVEWDVIRMVCYVCMVPRDKASDEVLKKRQTAFEQHVTTTHWPQYYRARTGWDFVDHTFELDDVGLSLVGRERSSGTDGEVQE